MKVKYDPILGKLRTDDSLLYGAGYAGMAYLATDPGIPSGAVFYICMEDGIYTHFDGQAAQSYDRFYYNTSTGSWDLIPYVNKVIDYNENLVYSNKYVSRQEEKAKDDGGTLIPNGAASIYKKLVDMGIEWDANLIFAPYAGKATKLYSLKPFVDGQFDVTRASTAKYTNEDGKLATAAINEPRFDFSDGKPVLLTEDAGENLLTHPLTMSNFAQSGATLDNNGGAGYPAPSVDYPTGALRLVEDVSNGTHQITKYIGAADGTTYTTSFYIKAGERTEVVLYGGNKGNDNIIINLIDGTIIPGSNVVNSSIKAVGNGWYNCFVAIHNSAKQIYLRLYNGITESYQGDGTSGVYIAFPQLEQNSFTSSWMFSNTEGATSLRSADDISLSGLNYRTEATFFDYTNSVNGEFHKYTYRFTDDGQMETFIDGVSQGKVSQSVPTSKALISGRWKNCLIFNRALTDEEIVGLNN